MNNLSSCKESPSVITELTFVCFPKIQQKTNVRDGASKYLYM